MHLVFRKISITSAVPIEYGLVIVALSLTKKNERDEQLNEIHIGSV